MTWVDHESGGHVGGRKVLAAPELPPGGLVRTAAAKVPAAERVVTARRHLHPDPRKGHVRGHVLVQLGEARGVLTGLALAHASLGYLAELRRDGVAAGQHHRASLDAAGGAADLRAQALAREGLAGAASLRGDARATGRLLGAAALREGNVGPVQARSGNRPASSGFSDTTL